MSRHDGPFRLHAVLIVSPSLFTLIDLRRVLSFLLAVALLLPQFAGAAPLSLSPFSASAPAVSMAFCCQDDTVKMHVDAGNDVTPVTEAQSNGDTDPLSGDQSFEMDKISAPIAAQWRVTAFLWGGDYLAVLVPDPIFSFDRPPR